MAQGISLLPGVEGVNGDWAQQAPGSFRDGNILKRDLVLSVSKLCLSTQNQWTTCLK